MDVSLVTGITLCLFGMVTGQGAGPTTTQDPYYATGLNGDVSNLVNCVLVTPGQDCSAEEGTVIGANNRTDRCIALGKLVSCAAVKCKDVQQYQPILNDIAAYCAASSILTNMAAILFLTAWTAVKVLV